LSSDADGTLAVDALAIPKGLAWQQYEALAREQDRLAKTVDTEIRVLLGQLTAHEESARRLRALSQRAMPPKPQD